MWRPVGFLNHLWDTCCNLNAVYEQLKDPTINFGYTPHPPLCFIISNENLDCERVSIQSLSFLTILLSHATCGSLVLWDSNRPVRHHSSHLHGLHTAHSILFTKKSSWSWYGAAVQKPINCHMPTEQQLRNVFWCLQHIALVVLSGFIE